MELLIHKYCHNPNEKIDSIYVGVASGNRTVVAIRKPSTDCNRMETTRVYGPGLPRGQGGRVGILVIGGMETSLDEVQDIVAAKQAKQFIPRRSQNDIAAMCRLVAARRNNAIEDQRKQFQRNPSMRPKKRRMRLHLPVGYRMVQTSEPGLKVLARG